MKKTSKFVAYLNSPEIFLQLEINRHDQILSNALKKETTGAISRYFNELGAVKQENGETKNIVYCGVQPLLDSLKHTHQTGQHEKWGEKAAALAIADLFDAKGNIKKDVYETLNVGGVLDQLIEKYGESEVKNQLFAGHMVSILGEQTTAPLALMNQEAMDEVFKAGPQVDLAKVMDGFPYNKFSNVITNCIKAFADPETRPTNKAIRAYHERNKQNVQYLKAREGFKKALLDHHPHNKLLADEANAFLTKIETTRSDPHSKISARELATVLEKGAIFLGDTKNKEKEKDFLAQTKKIKSRANLRIAGSLIVAVCTGLISVVFALAATAAGRSNMFNVIGPFKQKQKAAKISSLAKKLTKVQKPIHSIAPHGHSGLFFDGRPAQYVISTERENFKVQSQGPLKYGPKKTG